MSIPELSPFVWSVSAFVFMLGVIGFAWRESFATVIYGLWSQFDNPDTAEPSDSFFVVGGTVRLADGRHGTITAIWPDDDEFQVMLDDGKLLILNVDEV